MKKIFFLVGALVVSLPTAGYAMTLGDVLQQYEIYKNEAAKNPAVLGASSEGGVPTSPTTIPVGGAPVLMKALVYSEGSSEIIDGTLTYGMKTNDEVRKLQLFLIAKGYLSADPTGNYYTQTKNAVHRFQKEKGIISDGRIVGPQTKAAISADVSVIAGRME